MHYSRQKDTKLISDLQWAIKTIRARISIKESNLSQAIIHGRALQETDFPETSVVMTSVVTH